MTHFDPSARGSDVPRSFNQYLARKFGALVVSILGLNRTGYVTTEIVQQIDPTCTIPTSFGGIRCKCGHGRLRWRAETFYTEEPQTISWLEAITRDDCLWDIGANVGLYSIYPARRSGCKVLAVEPEAQNFALLVENIVLNGVQQFVEASNLAISRSLGLGRLYVHDLTKGGAYNQFQPVSGSSRGNGEGETAGPLSQIQMGVSLDDLVNRFGLDCPTHIKIDVDGNEPEIIAGALQVLGNERCRHLLIEVERSDPGHLEMVDPIEKLGFRLVAERSNWESRENRDKEHEYPVTNMIFVKQ